MLSQFKKENPGIVIRIEEGNTLEVMNLIEAGRADCGVVISSMVPYVLAHPKPANRFDPLRLTDIAGTPFIIMKSGQAFHEYFYQLCAEEKLSFPVTLETQSILTVPALIATGIGAALISSTIVEECIARRIAVYMPAVKLPANDVSIAWKRNRYQSHAT